MTSTAGAFGALSTLISGLRSLGNNTAVLNSWAGDGTYWVPTLSVYVPATPEEDTEVARKIVAHHKEVFQKAMKMGIKIAFGTDVGAFEHGTSEREFERMVSYGMTPLNVSVSGTSRARRLMM